MTSLRFQKVKLSKEASNRFRQLKGHTGLTPNVLCRYALARSLDDSRPVTLDYDTGGAELNRATLMGDHDSLIIGLVKERCVMDGIAEPSEADVVSHLVAHINRGALALSSVREVEDLVLLAK